MWCLRPAAASTVPRMAALSLSVPQEVKTISEGSQLKSAATCSRARSTWLLASSTSGATRVVALLSM